METDPQELTTLSYGIMCFHPSVSLSRKKLLTSANDEDKILGVCEKTANLRSRKFSHLNSAYLKASVISFRKNILVPRHA